MSQRVEAVWRAAAGDQPVPAALSALQAPGSEAFVLLSGDRIVFGLSALSPRALDDILERVAGAHNRTLAEQVFQRLVAGRRGVQWSIGLEVGDVEPTLHLSATASTSTGTAATLAELREALAPAMPWPDALPGDGALTGWTVLFAPTGTVGFAIEAPARSAWLPPAAFRALRDLPEVGTVRISIGHDGRPHYASRTVIHEDDPEACWEAALVPLAAYGRDTWAHRLIDVPGAVPSAICLDGQDITLEIKVS